MNFTCPRDQSPLSDHASFLHCALCDTEYSKTANLYSFLTEPNTFYEGAYLNRVKFTGTGIKFFDRFVFWLINSGYLGKVQHTFPQGSRLLELGCAGGVISSFFWEHLDGLEKKCCLKEHTYEIRLKSMLKHIFE